MYQKKSPGMENRSLKVSGKRSPLRLKFDLLQFFYREMNALFCIDVPLARLKDEPGKVQY